MNNSRHIWLFMALVVLVPVAAYGVVKWYERTFQKLPVLVANDHMVADFTMTNQDGKPVTNAAWNDKIVVVDFFFTHCPSICPKMTYQMKRVQQAYAGDNDVQIASFSVDPERDSAAQLKQYVAKMNLDTKNWNLLTGDKTAIYRLARKSFFIVATDGDGGPEDFIHSERFVLIDGQKRIRGYYDGTSETEVNQLINDIQKLKHED